MVSPEFSANKPIVLYHSPEVNLCPPFFKEFDSKMRASVLLHEWTEIFGNTQEFGYWRGDEYEDKDGNVVELGVGQLIGNSDTYRMFLEEFLGSLKE